MEDRLAKGPFKPKIATSKSPQLLFHFERLSGFRQDGLSDHDKQRRATYALQGTIKVRAAIVVQIRENSIRILQTSVLPGSSAVLPFGFLYSRLALG